ncbi:MAG: hypothetical protein AB1411_16775 [Nitrospirota bacterium]
MRCPHFIEERTTGATSLCIAVIVPFEPSTIERIDYCTTGRHRHCPLYRNASNDLSLAIHREVARAVG